MTQQTLNNNETGKVIRDKINDNFTEVYGGQIPTINLTGGQIAFPATAVLSGDPNTLDDYEEGTWSIEMICGSGTITLSGLTGLYTKTGRNVVLSANLVVIGVNSPSGTLEIHGLPFLSLNVAGALSAVSLAPYNLNVTAATMMSGEINVNKQIINLFHFAAGVRGDAGADFKIGSQLNIGVTYFAA